MIVFGVVVSWSIYISGKKACQLRKEENEKLALERGDYMEMAETDVEPTGDSEIPERTATAMNEGGEGSQEDKTS